jgi:leucyl aminopeptidase
MRIRVSGEDLAKLKADLAVCFAYEKDSAPRGVKDAGLRRELAAQMKSDGFKGEAGDRLVWNADGRYPARRFLILGLGPEGQPPGESLRLGCARAARAAAGLSAKRMALRLPLPARRSRTADEEIRAACEGVWLGAYRFDRYLTDPSRQKTALTNVELAVDGPPAGNRRSAERGQVAGRAINLARDLVNEAPSRLTPRAMARNAAREARSSGLSCRVLGPAEIRRAGLVALLAVARGSREPAQVVHLTYRPRAAKAKKKRKKTTRILLIGKGVTFDSGGLNLKSGDSMLTMKSDMAGSAAVLAAMTTLGSIGCSVEVHALLGLVENMTSGAAYKPGDILDTHAGKTVEVGNTDAEGRLVLCDLLSYGVAKLKPTHVVDLATLTGACVVALGTRATGLFTRHDPLRDALLVASRNAGEKLWPLPMYEEYLQLLQKGPADLCNIGGRWAGAITAALFLGEFLPRDVPWAHLDIAGPAFADDELPECSAGATGAGVSTLVRWLEGA